VLDLLYQKQEKMANMIRFQEFGGLYMYKGMTTVGVKDNGLLQTPKIQSSIDTDSWRSRIKLSQRP